VEAFKASMDVIKNIMDMVDIVDITATPCHTILKDTSRHHGNNGHQGPRIKDIRGGHQSEQLS
jgi:hypothetical protein